MQPPSCSSSGYGVVVVVVGSLFNSGLSICRAGQANETKRRFLFRDARARRDEPGERAFGGAAITMDRHAMPSCRSRRCGYCRGGGLSCLLVGDGVVMASGSRHEECRPTMDGQCWGFGRELVSKISTKSNFQAPGGGHLAGRQFMPAVDSSLPEATMASCRDRTTPCFQFPWCCQLAVFRPTASAGEGCRIRRSHKPNAPME